MKTQKQTSKEPMFLDYDDMYDWWHNKDSTLDELTESDLISLINLCDFDVYKVRLTNKEIAERQFIVDYWGKPYTQEELEDELSSVENPEETKEVFCLKDLQGANLCHIEQETFTSLQKVCERLLEPYMADIFSEY